MIVIPLGTLTSAASATAIDLKDYGQYALTGRSGLFIIAASDDAALTVELEEYVDGIEDSSGTWASGTWTDVAGTQEAIAAGEVQCYFKPVTVNEEYIRLTVSAFTSGDVMGTLVFSN